MAVAANDGHAGLGGTEFRADYMHDPLLRRLHIVELNAKVGAVCAQGVHLLGGNGVFDDEPVGGGGYIVVHRSHAAIGAPYRSSCQAESFKRLRGGDLMQQVQIDVEECRLALGSDDYMRIPNLFE